MATFVPRQKRRPSLAPVALVVILLAVGAAGAAMYPVSITYTFYVAHYDTPPAMPLVFQPRTGIIRAPLVLSLTGRAPLPPEFATPPQGCAARFITKGQVVTPSDVISCTEVARVAVPVPPEQNPVDWRGNTAWYCTVPAGPGERGDWCDECLRQGIEVTNTLSLWTVISPTDQPNPLEHGIPEGILCVSGWAGRPYTEKGVVATPCKGGATGYQPSAAVFPARKSTITENLQPQESCSDDPPVSREIVVPRGAIVALGIMRHYAAVVRPIFLEGNLPIAPVGFWYHDGTWYAIGDIEAAEAITSTAPLTLSPLPIQAPTRTPVPTPLPVLTATPTITLTPALTATPSITLTPTLTATPTATPARTPAPSAPTPRRTPRIKEEQ